MAEIQMEVRCHVMQNTGTFLFSSFFFNILLPHFPHPTHTHKALPWSSSLSISTFQGWCLNSHWKKWQATNRSKFQFLRSCQHLVVRCLHRSGWCRGFGKSEQGLFCVSPIKGNTFELLSNAEMHQNKYTFRRARGLRGAL